jgi:hypothetical protein
LGNFIGTILVFVEARKIKKYFIAETAEIARIEAEKKAKEEATLKARKEAESKKEALTNKAKQRPKNKKRR